MTTVKELIEVFKKRKAVANKKVESKYRTEYNQGVAFAYAEALSDLYRMDREL